MERLKSWTYSNPPTDGEECRGSGVGVFNVYRPPPLRTVGTYDDDEFFNNVALNMLSRYGALNLSVEEAICSTLISPRNRASFYESLCARSTRSCHLSPSQRSLIQDTRRVFGKALKRIVEAESPSHHTHNYQQQQHQQHCDIFLKNGMDISDTHHPPVTPRHHNYSGGGWCPKSTTSEKKKKGRKFFPDSDSSKSGGFFRSRKVQNIDWRLAEAIQQVQTLRLDGDSDPALGDHQQHHQNNHHHHARNNMGYQPPHLG